MDFFQIIMFKNNKYYEGTTLGAGSVPVLTLRVALTFNF
jgi:hypothetical protein